MQYTNTQKNSIRRNIEALRDHYTTEKINDNDNIETRILLLKGILNIEEKYRDNLISEKKQKKEEARKQKLIAQLHKILDFLKNNNFKDGDVLFSRIETEKSIYRFFIKISFHNNNLLFERTNISWPLQQDFGNTITEYITDESLNSYSRGERYLSYIYETTVGGESPILESIPQDIQSRLLQSRAVQSIQPSSAQDGGKPKIYKITDTKVHIVHNKKMLSRNVYIKKNTKYCKINNKFILLSKLKKNI
jgi:hypothetical protein